MGFFDSLKNQVAPSFDVQKAIMTIVVSAVKSDGDVSDEEIGRIRTMCLRSPIFATNSKEEDDAVIRFADSVTKQLGFGAVEKAAAALKPELRETAFAFACDIVLADGIVGDEEDAFLSRLAAVLGISNAVGELLVNATIIRNRGIN